MDNILINFTADPAGLQPGIDGMAQLEQADKELLAAINKTTDAENKRNKAISTNAKAGKKDVEGLTAAFNNLGKSGVGSTYNKSLADLQKNLKGTTDEFKQLALVVDVAKQKLKTLDPGSAEFKDLSAQITAGQVILQKFGEEQTKTEVKTKSLRQELRLLREEVASRKLAGESGPEIDALIAKAGELDDTLKDVSQQIANTGSDTRAIEGFVQIAGTATQTVAGLEAAQSLLGDESEEFQKVMVKLNALLVLSNSIQSIQTALQKESAAVLLVTNAQRRIGVLVTHLQTAAESEYVVVRYAAIAAQRILNAVMTASPAGILLTAIGAVAAAVVYFSRSTEDASEAQAKLNTEMENAIEINDRYNDAIGRSNDIVIEKMKLNGADAQQIRDQQLKFAKEDLARQQALEDSQRAAYDRANEIRQNTIVEGKKFDEKELEQASKTIDAFEKISSKKQQLQDAADLLEVKNKVATKDELQKFEEEAEKARDDAFEKQKAKNDKRRAELAALADRDRKAQQEIAKLDLQEQVRQREQIANDSNTPTASKLQAVADSFELSKQLLAKEREFELENSKLTGNERKLVVAKYLAEISKLEQENGKRVADIIKDAGEEQKKRTAEALEARVAEIENKRGGRISELQRQIVENDGILATAKLTSEQQFQIRQDTAQKIGAIGRQESIQATELYEAGKLSYQQYQEALTKAAQTGLQSRQEQAEIEFRQEEFRINRKLDLETRAADITKTIGDNLFDLDRDRYQRELAQDQQLFDSKLITQNEFNERKAALDRQQAERQKQKAVFDILVDLGKALFQIEAQAAVLSSNPLTAALAVNAYAQEGFLIGEAALQTAFILAKKYKTGKIGIEGPGTETSDSIPAWLSRGESVVKADMTGKHREALQAINSDNFQQYLLNVEMPKLWNNYEMPMIPEGMEGRVVQMKQQPIDYDKLGEVIAKKLGDHQQLTMIMDENGFTKSIQIGLDTIEYKNKKLLA